MCGGFIEDAVGGFTDAFEDIGGGIADLGQGAIDAVSDAGSSIDDVVNQIPGGWTTAALLAAGAYYAPEIGAWMSAEGAPLASAADVAASDVAAQQAAATSMAGANSGIAGITLADDVAAQQAAAAGMTGGSAAAGGIGVKDALKYAGLASLVSGALSPKQPNMPSTGPQAPVGVYLSPDYKPYRYQPYAEGGITALAEGGYNLGGYSDGGRLLRGPGDGVSDDIPATIGGKQPARLADGEFVVPARIVSEIGNGSTDAGARKLYEMMDRVQSARRKTMGKKKFAKDTNADKYLPV